MGSRIGLRRFAPASQHLPTPSQEMDAEVMPQASNSDGERSHRRGSRARSRYNKALMKAAARMVQECPREERRQHPEDRGEGAYTWQEFVDWCGEDREWAGQLWIDSRVVIAEPNAVDQVYITASPVATSSESEGGFLLDLALSLRNTARRGQAAHPGVMRDLLRLYGIPYHIDDSSQTLAQLVRSLYLSLLPITTRTSEEESFRAMVAAHLQGLVPSGSREQRCSAAARTLFSLIEVTTASEINTVVAASRHIEARRRAMPRLAQ